ncbi:MAG TPA: hypothetical protein VNT75_21695, partial [Symbiobacteriaceae bacterium]|nr:hypothetical protein [Symbiobacteriaceae bacterium]
MGRNLVLLVAAALLTAACTRSDPPAPAPVAVTEVRTPAPETVAPAAAPAAEQEKPVAEQDITGDGRAERIFFKSEKGQVRILDTEGQVLFEFLIPEFHRLGSDVAVLPLSDRPPLVLISWPWCLRSYPNNLFVWFDPA